MITWQATIKEVDNEHLLTPTYSFPNGGMFSNISNESQREQEMQNFLIKFWGLEEDDVEWYKLERIE